MPGFWEEKKRQGVFKERHLLPDKTATSAKGLLSPQINLTPLDSEITISTNRADLQGQDFTRSNSFVKCQWLYLWLLLWGRCGPPYLPFLSRGLLRELLDLIHSITPYCCDLWPLGADIRRAELSLTFISMFPLSSHLFSSFYPPFHPWETCTNKISPQVCSFECHTRHHYAVF